VEQPSRSDSGRRGGEKKRKLEKKSTLTGKTVKNVNGRKKNRKKSSPRVDKGRARGKRKKYLIKKKKNGGGRRDVWVT